MDLDVSTTNEISSDRVPSWSGVYALSLGAFALIASEFMLVSLLTPIASELQITEARLARRSPCPAPSPS
jgi:predicted MFS family arabinose efflux permease